MTSYTEQELKIAVKNSFSYSQVLTNLGLSKTGSSYNNIKKKIIKLDLNTEHFNTRLVYSFNKKKWQDVLVDGYSQRITTKQLRKALIESGVKYVCNRCCNSGTWLGENLVLEIDHIDGNWSNNKKENLRFLCPNCHSLTSNFYHKRKVYVCKTCGKNKKTKSEQCLKCACAKNNKINKEKVIELIWKKPIIEIAKELDVSDSAIIKFCKKNQIDKPKRGYWLKIAH